MAGIKFDFTSDNKNLLNSAKQAQTGVTNAINGIEQAGRGIESTFSKIKGSVLGGFADIAKGMVGLTALLQAGNFFKTLIDDAAKFNVAMKEVSTLSEDVARNFQQYKEQVVDMTTQIPIGATEAAKALYQIESAGHHGADGLNVLRESAKGAIGGVTETATTADAITTILNAYKMESSEAQHVSDLLFTTVRLGKTNMSQLGSTIAQVAPVAASFGVSIEDVLAAIASLTKQGTKTAVAVRQVRDAITATTKSMGDGAFQGRSFLDAMDEVAQKAQGSNNALRQDLGTLQALNAVLSLTGKNSQAARQDVADMQNSAGAAEAAYEKMASTAGTQTTLLRNNIFKDILPLAEGIKSMSGDIARYFNEAFDSGAMDKALVSLEAFIAAYATYRGLLAATTAWNTAALGGTYQLQIAELQKLIPLKELDGQADLQAAVAKGTLTTEQAKLVASLRAETEARYEEIMAAEAEARANLKALTVAEVSAQANMVAAEELVAAAQARVAAAIESGSASEIEAAKEELNTANRLKNTAATELNTIQRQKNGAATMVSVTAKNADTAATLMNTTQQGANATSTGLLAAAKLKLKMAIDAVNSSFLASPLFWIGATIAAVAYAVYSLVTAESANEAAIRKANDAMDEQNKKLGERRDAIDRLIRTIQDSNATDYQKAKAYDELKQVASDITDAYSKEAIASMEAAKAQKLLNESMDEATFEEASKKVEVWEKKVEDMTKRYEKYQRMSQEGVDVSMAPDFVSKSQLEEANAQLEIYRDALEKIVSLREEASKVADEESKPIEIRVQEAKSNEIEKQRVFDFFDQVMTRVEDIQTSQNNLNFDEAQNKLDAYIREIQGDLADLHQQVEKNPLDQKLQMQESEKIDLLNKLLQWKADIYAGGFSTVPLFFKINWDSANAALLTARNHATTLFNQTVVGGAQNMADLFNKASNEYQSALKEWKRVSNPKNMKNVTPEEYNKAKSNLSQAKSTYESYGGDPDGKKAKAAASAARQAAQSAKQLANQQEQERKQREKYQQMLKKQQLEQKRDAEDMAYDTRQAEIDALHDGVEKTMSQIQLDFEKQEAAIKRGYEDLKQTKIDAARSLWEANPDNKGKSFDESTVNVNYTQAEIDNYNAQIAANNAQRLKSLEELKREQSQALYEYLKEFGTAEQQRLAIAEEYDRKIAESRTEGERNTLVAQREQALQSHDMEQQRKATDMESLFNNLGQMSLDKLQQAKEELRGMLSAQNLGMDDYKTIAEQIDKVEDAIVEKQKQKKGLLGALIPGETTVQRLKRQQAEAEEQVKAATEKVVELQQQLAGQKLGIFSLLSMGGANYTGDISAANRSAIMESARNAGFSPEKLEELEKAMDGLVVTTDNLNNANKNEEEAKKKVSEKQMLLGEAVGNLQQKVSDFAASLETINANIQALPALMDSLGLGNTGAGQAISSVASAANNTMGAMTDFSSGNYVGAAVKAVGAVKDVAGAFSPDNTAKMQKKIDELNGHSDALAMAMKSLQKAFEKSYGIDAMRNAEKQRQLLESQQRDAQMAMVYEARKHGANRSTLNASVNDNYDWQVAMAMVSQILGKNVRESGNDFLQLSASEMQKIIDYDNGELWNKILAEYRKEGGTGGRSDQLPDMLQSYVDNFADAFDELDEVLNERLTTTTLDNVFGDYKNYLYDLANGSEDVFENIEKNWQAMINRMVVDNLIFRNVQDSLSRWYEDLASLQRDKNEGNISPEEYARRLEALKDSYTDIMKGSQQEIEDFKEWGIIKPIEEAVEEAKTAFGSLRDTFKDSLLDIESDADTFKKNLQRTLYEDLIEKNVFDVPFTINGQTFDDFEAYSKDWNERYAAAVAEGDTAALDALINELVEAREITATAAESYREALKKLDEQFDTTFKDMGGSWVNMLMGMDSDAETWGKEIGRTMAQKIIEQMILADTMQPLLDTLQDEFNRAMADGSSWEAVLADEGVNAALAEIEKAYPALQETVTTIMDRLGLKVEEQAKQGFSDLRSLMTSALLDTEGDMETFGKSMAETMMKQMLDTMIDSKYKERMNAISAEWAEALEAADPARIDAVKQQVMDLYKEIGDDSEIKQLTADIKALTEVTEDTATPFDNLRSSYQSYLMDVKKDTKDFTEDLNKMLADAFVDKFVMGKAMDELIDKYKGQFKAIRDDATLSKEERAKQMKALGGLIAEEAEGLKAETKEVLSWFGLSNNVEDQGAAMNMAEAATYDQFELYLGIATAQQINGEQQLSVQQQILSTLQSMSGITSPNGETVKEISSRMRTANEYLLSIRDSNKAILDTMTRKLDVINSNLTRIL